MNDVVNNEQPAANTQAEASRKPNRHYHISATEFAGAYYDAMFKDAVDGSEYTHRFPEYKDQAKAVFVSQYVINSEKEFTDELNEKIAKKIDKSLTIAEGEDEDHSRESLVSMLSEGVEAASIELVTPIANPKIVKILQLQQAPQLVGSMSIDIVHTLEGGIDGLKDALKTQNDLTAAKRETAEAQRELNSVRAENAGRDSWFKPVMTGLATAALLGVMYIAYKIGANQEQNNANAKATNTAIGSVGTKIDSTAKAEYFADSLNRNLTDHAIYGTGAHTANQVRRSGNKIVKAIKENMVPQQADTSAALKFVPAN